jgi:uncharacterized protein
MPFRRGARLDPSQVEDLRGRRVVPGGPVAIGGGGLGIVGLVLYLVISLLGNGSGLGALGTLDDQTVGGSSTRASLADCQTGDQANASEDCRIVGYVNSVQKYWSGRLGSRYTLATTRFFSGSVDTGCGTATSQVGPFYCPVDKHVYIDLGFFDDLHSKFGATAGSTAQGYVLAHEYGHHVQDLLGIEQRVRPGETGPTSGSVRLELQADCFAGVWAGHAAQTGYLTPLTKADIADALDAAAAVGDDRIQKRFQGHVNPETWTHGSSAERQHWFTVGYSSGDMAKCDTFAAKHL